jgi:protein-glutamine gamma-glutamyltransferase
MVEKQLEKLVRKTSPTAKSSAEEQGAKYVYQKTWGTWLLACLGSFAIFLLRFQAETIPVASITEYVLLIVGSFGVHYELGRHLSRRKSTSSNSALRRRLLFIAGLLVILSPWIRNFVTRSLFGGRGEATELVWLGMLQHAAVWQAAVAITSRHEWTSFLLSCFMMLFGVATSDRNGMVLVVIPFGLLASWWLLSQYWRSVAKGFVAHKSVPLVRIRLGIIGALICLTAIVGLIAVNTGRGIISLDGFMPTSGGKGGNDQAARQGVGDGDMMVAAKDQAYTFGPIESEVFLESQLPSLYDLATEKYGEAKKPNKEVSRAVSLEQQAQHTHEKITESKQKSREFSTLRTPSQKSSVARPGDKKSSAILHVIGTLPLHLRLETFDSFDGIEWSQSDIDLKKQAPEFQIANLGGKPWAVNASYVPDIVWPVRERATIKLIQYKSIRIPSPALTTHVHVDKIDQADFYSLTPDGQLCMPSRPYIPQLTVLHLLYHTPCLHVLRDSNQNLSRLAYDQQRLQYEANGHLAFLTNYLQVPESLDSISTMRTSLLSDTPESIQRNWTDWQRIEAVIGALRATCIVDPGLELSEDVSESVTSVLTNHRGTDYHIASAAVMLLRDWKIPSRLVTGFYCDTKRWDRIAGMAEVLGEDLHTWVEVYVHGAWIPVEPCGTYQQPREHRSWYQWCVEAVWSSRDSVLSHPIRYASGLLLLIAIVMMRRRLANAIASTVVAFAALLPAETKIRVVLRLLRFRDWLCGVRFPLGTTVSGWLEEQFRYLPVLTREDRTGFIARVQALAYAPNQNRSREPYLDPFVSRLFWTIITQGITDLFRVQSVFRKRKKSPQSSKVTLSQS